MDAATLNQNGYRVSMQVTDEEVDLAYRDVEAAYVKRIFDFDRPSGGEQEALMCLTYILLLQRHSVATRAGGKTKLSPSLSTDSGPTQQDFAKADMLLRKIQENRGDLAAQGLPSTLVDDICGIYYRTNFLGL